jgi:hypothetical protein
LLDDNLDNDNLFAEIPAEYPVTPDRVRSSFDAIAKIEI